MLSIKRSQSPHGKKIVKNNKKKKGFKLNLSQILINFGLFFIAVGLFIILLTFYPMIKEETRYQIIKRAKNNQKMTEIKPVDKSFSIVIPKINVNSKVVANVDPFNEKIYQKALSQGVAHAQGSALPNEVGNIFLFSHSSVNWYVANRYNSVFYLLNKLEKKDQIIIYHQNQKYMYQVFEKKVIDADAIKYLFAKPSQKTLILMTCWPPGTTLKRLIVLATLSKK